MPFQNECFIGLGPGWITRAHKVCTVMLIAVLDPAGSFQALTSMLGFQVTPIQNHYAANP